ncbi:unnamed protein product [Protopolystoma xenopodis]|uniref:Uncharacterized protein n=1 Tax=Protopolystoma xenopodis TaxID=117903 RepID=A0A3S5B708_9PLAT|nr:unnamed protein product [Protopolystoma xenopodis]
MSKEGNGLDQFPNPINSGTGRDTANSQTPLPSSKIWSTDRLVAYGLRMYPPVLQFGQDSRAGPHSGTRSDGVGSLND